MFKRISSIFLALCMVLSLTVSVSAAENSEAEGIVATVTYEDGGVTYTDSYATLESALSNTISGDKVVLVDNYTLAESVDIPAGVTLTIPTAADANDTLTGNNAGGQVVNGSAYKTLTIPNGKTLTVNGTLLVAGNQQSTQPKTGCLTGDYGAIEVKTGGNITVNSGAEFYARGDIYGAGTVTAKDGSKVYQMLQINDWRGGSATSNIYSNVFPFNYYELSNITAKTTYEYGSKLYAHYYVFFSKYGITANSENDALAIGQDNATDALFSLNSGSSSVEFDGTNVTLHGNVSTGPLTVIFNAVFTQVSVSSQGLNCPINMNITVDNGATLNVTETMKVLPGYTVTVNGTLNVAEGEAVCFYDASHYLSTYNFAGISSANNAVLTGSGSVSGTIATSDSELGNLPNGYATTGTDLSVQEYIQSTNNYDTVTFYVAVAGSAE